MKSVSRTMTVLPCSLSVRVSLAICAAMDRSAVSSRIRLDTLALGQGDQLLFIGGAVSRVDIDRTLANAVLVYVIGKNNFIQAKYFLFYRFTPLMCEYFSKTGISEKFPVSDNFVCIFLVMQQDSVHTQCDYKCNFNCILLCCTCQVLGFVQFAVLWVFPAISGNV